MNRAVIFDFDGVLADTEGLHLRAFQVALEPLGFTFTRDDYYSRFIGLSDHDFIETIAVEHGRTLATSDFAAVVEAKSREYWRQLSTGAVLYDAAARTVARLGRRYRLGIASGSFRSEIASILSANQLGSAIPVIVGADDVKKHKPHPDPYEMAVLKLGVNPARAVAIEDTPLGLMSAQAAGLRTIGITTSHELAYLSQADVVVGHLDEITIDLVDGLIGLE